MKASDLHNLFHNVPDDYDLMGPNGEKIDSVHVDYKFGLIFLKQDPEEEGKE